MLTRIRTVNIITSFLVFGSILLVSDMFMRSGTYQSSAELSRTVCDKMKDNYTNTRRACGLQDSCSAQDCFCSIPDELTLKRNSFLSLGYFADHSLTINSEDLSIFSNEFFRILESKPEEIVYSRRQRGRLKFRFGERKNNGVEATRLLSKMKTLLNKHIWLCQSILLGKDSVYDEKIKYTNDKKFKYSVSGNHVYEQNSFEQFPHSDVDASGYPKICSVGFYLQDVTSRDMAPFEIWPVTHHLIGSYALKNLNDKSSANDKETGQRSTKVIRMYEGITSNMPGKIFLSKRGEIMIRDCRALHRGTKLTLANYNRTMVELQVRKG